VESRIIICCTRGNWILVCFLKMPRSLLRGYLLTDTGLSQNEASMMHDINGDGVPEWVTNSYNVSNAMAVWSFTSEEREVQVQKGNKVVLKNSGCPA
jgi:hypothetical protein